MTTYFLQILVDSIEIYELENSFLGGKISAFHKDQILEVNMYIDKGPMVVIGGREYNAIFRYYQKTYVISSLIQLGYVVDVTKQIKRNETLINLGIDESNTL